MMRFANSTSSTRWAHQPGTRAIANERGVQVLADAEHTVDQAAEQVHVGADLLRAVLFLGKDLRGQALMLHSSSYSSS